LTATSAIERETERDSERLRGGIGIRVAVWCSTKLCRSRRGWHHHFIAGSGRDASKIDSLISGTNLVKYLCQWTQMDGDDDLEVNGASGGPRWQLLSRWSSLHRVVERAYEGKRKTMTVSSDWWDPPVIYQTSMGTGPAGSWAAAQVSLSPLFFSCFKFFSIFCFSVL
jgi:hypothetical protein